MVLMFALTVLILVCPKVVVNESTTSLLSRGDITEGAYDTTPVWSAVINTTEEPLQPSRQPFLEEVYNFWFYAVGIGCNTFSIFGIIGNILSIIVLYSRAMWSSTSVFLITLASFDIMLLLTHILANIDLILTYSPYKASLLYKVYFLQPVFPILYSLAAISHTGSIYAVVSVNVERYIAICHPLKAASYCTISNAKKVTLVVVAVSVLYNIPRYMEIYWVWTWEPEINRIVLGINYSDMAYSSIYVSVYLVYVNAVFKFIIPAVALLTLNTIMVRKLYHARPSLNKQERKGTEKERFTAMVLAVFVVFMISLSAAFIELVMYEVNSAVTLAECSELCGYISAVSQLAVVINSASNFILFCFFGQKFRKVFATKFMSCRRR